MEVRVEERLIGRQLKDRILERYGSVERLAELARRKSAHEAQDDLAILREFDEDPSRLLLSTTMTTIVKLSAKDLERLTPERLRLLEALAGSTEAPSLTALAKRLRRDKKNVSEDLSLLSRLGLVTLARRGKERLARPLGSDIRIVLRPALS